MTEQTNKSTHFHYSVPRVAEGHRAEAARGTPLKTRPPGENRPAACIPGARCSVRRLRGTVLLPFESTTMEVALKDAGKLMFEFVHRRGADSDGGGEVSEPSFGAHGVPDPVCFADLSLQQPWEQSARICTPTPVRPRHGQRGLPEATRGFPGLWFWVADVWQRPARAAETPPWSARGRPLSGTVRTHCC